MILTSYSAENISRKLGTLVLAGMVDNLVPGTILCRFTMDVTHPDYCRGGEGGFARKELRQDFLTDIANIVDLLGLNFKKINSYDFVNDDFEKICFHPQEITGCVLPETLAKLIDLVGTSSTTIKKLDCVSLHGFAELAGVEELKSRFALNQEAFKHRFIEYFFTGSGRRYLPKPRDALLLATTCGLSGLENLLVYDARPETINFLQELTQGIADSLVNEGKFSFDAETGIYQEL